VDTGLFKDAEGNELFALDKKSGGVKGDKTTLQTSRENVFVAGEVHTGRNILIQAVADGRRAARAIHHYITEGEIPEPRNPQLRVIPESILKNMDITYTIPRIKVPEISIEERRSTFKEEVKSFVEYDAARKEGSRCLRCGLTCYDSEAGAEYVGDADVKPFSEVGKE